MFRASLENAVHFLASGLRPICLQVLTQRKVNFPCVITCIHARLNCYRNITKAEFDKIPKEDVNKAIEELFLKTQPNVAGAKMLVNIKQEPFVSRDRDTKAIKWTDKPFNANICTKPVLKVIQELQKSGVEVDKFPVILFSNKVSAYGFGFYNDYNENAELKNSTSYDFIQSLGAAAESGSETAADNGEIAF